MIHFHNGQNQLTEIYMKIRETIALILVAGSLFLLSGCYAYGGNYNGKYYKDDGPTHNVGYRHKYHYNPRYHHYRYRHYRHGYRPYGAVEYRHYRRYQRSYRRECWNHIHKTHYYC